MKHYYDRSGEESFSRYITPKIQRLWPLHFSTMLFCFILQQIRVANGLDFYVYQANSITDVIVGTFSGAFCNAGVIVKWTGMDNVGNVFLLYYILDHYEI